MLRHLKSLHSQYYDNYRVLYHLYRLHIGKDVLKYNVM